MSHSIMIIMRGVSGSGKSTRANRLAREHDMVVCSADDFFVSEDGEYNFDVTKLSAAHDACFRKARNAMREAKPVVIDNTNTSRAEYTPYVMLARLFGYEVRIHQMHKVTGEDMPTLGFLDECAEKNVHGVPLDAIRGMMERFEEAAPFDPPTTFLDRHRFDEQ